MDSSAASLTAVNTLRTTAKKNLSYFKKPTDRFHRFFALILEHTEAIAPGMDLLQRYAARYDFDNVPANGYRSLIYVTDICLCRLIQISREIESDRGAFLFRKKLHLRGLDEYSKILGALRTMLKFATRMLEQDKSVPGSLYPGEGSRLIDEWLENVETLNQEVFYSHSLGFQFCPSVRLQMQTIVSAMSVCVETYNSWEKWRPGSAKLSSTIPNVFTAGRLVMNPEIRAKRFVHGTRNAGVNFCKQFWNITEESYLQLGINLILPSIAINEVIELPVDADGVPGLEKKVFTRLISNIERTTAAMPTALSPSLIFHCHGGGFIAQSSKAHELYLVKWAKQLKVPIFCVDYALAPEGPYPRALDQVVYAYEWALKNHRRLGWTGEKVCFVGDSAGGNLIVAAALNISCKGLPLPTGLVAMYGAFLVQYTPSPSRLLSVMDPILPVGILTRCLAAYAGIPEPELVQGMDDKISHGNSVHNHDARRTSLASDQDLMSWDTADEYGCRGPVAGSSQSLNRAKTSSLHSAPTTRTNALNAAAQRTPPTVAERPATLRYSDSAGAANKVGPLPRYNFESISVEDPFLSPLLAQDTVLVGLPPVYLVACTLDPLLDDSISFARRLRQLNKAVHLDVVNLPHGFLSLASISTEVADATALCAKRIQQVLGIEVPDLPGIWQHILVE